MSTKYATLTCKLFTRLHVVSTDSHKYNAPKIVIRSLYALVSLTWRHQHFGNEYTEVKETQPVHPNVRRPTAAASRPVLDHGLNWAHESHPDWFRGFLTSEPAKPRSLTRLQLLLCTSLAFRFTHTWPSLLALFIAAKIRTHLEPVGDIKGQKHNHNSVIRPAICFVPPDGPPQCFKLLVEALARTTCCASPVLRCSPACHCPSLLYTLFLILNSTLTLLALRRSFYSLNMYYLARVLNWRVGVKTPKVSPPSDAQIFKRVTTTATAWTTTWSSSSSSWFGAKLMAKEARARCRRSDHRASSGEEREEQTREPNEHPGPLDSGVEDRGDLGDERKTRQSDGETNSIDRNSKGLWLASSGWQTVLGWRWDSTCDEVGASWQGRLGLDRRRVDQEAAPVLQIPNALATYLHELLAFCLGKWGLCRRLLLEVRPGWVFGTAVVGEEIWAICVSEEG